MKRKLEREPKWTASIAIGNKVYVEKVKDHMGCCAPLSFPFGLRQEIRYHFGASQSIDNQVDQYIALL